MEQVERLERFPQPDADRRLETGAIDLRFDVPVIDLRSEPLDLDLDLDFGLGAQPRELRGDDVVIDLRDDRSPMVVVGDGEPMSLFGGSTQADDDAEALGLPAVGMWTRPDRCLPILVNLARFRQGGVAAVSAERIDLTELAALASRRGDVDARRLARLARSCR